MSDAVLVRREGHALVITINRPDARNAVDLAVAEGVGTALEEGDQDPLVRVIVLTGAGDRAFCAGADLKALSRGERMFPEGREHWGFAGYVRHFVSTPTIAAVNGSALGGGTELVLASDLAIAAEHATFGLPEIRRGIIAAGGGAFRLAQQLPRKRANEMLLTAEAIDAGTALDWGLVNRVVPSGCAVESALELAATIAANAPLAVAASKRLSYKVGNEDHNLLEPGGETASWASTQTESAALRASADAREGVAAFVEKRTPVWTGS